MICLSCFHRDSPTKLDREVLSAVEGIDIDPQKYPSIYKWKSTMKSFSASDMQRLVSLADILLPCILLYIVGLLTILCIYDKSEALVFSG